MVHHGHTGMRRCLPRDKSIIARNPFLFKRLDLEEKGLLYAGSLIMCSWKHPILQNALKITGLMGKSRVGTDNSTLIYFVTTALTKTLTIQLKLLAQLNFDWLVSLAALNPGTLPSLRCWSWRVFIADRDYFHKN